MKVPSSNLQQALDAARIGKMRRGQLTVQCARSCPNGEWIAARVNGEIAVKRIAPVQPQGNDYVADTDAEDSVWQPYDPKRHNFQWVPI